MAVGTEPTRSTETILLAGEVDATAIANLLESIRSSTAATVVIDASGVTFIDSAGVGALLDAKDQLEAADRVLRVVRRTRMLNRLLDMTGMGEAFV
jgi:anti-anti-sigma factor